MHLKTSCKKWAPVKLQAPVEEILLALLGLLSKQGFNNMEIDEFVPLSQKTKKSVKAKKKALASFEETKRKEKEKRVSKERGKLFEQISLRTGHPIDKVYRNTYFGCQHSF